MLALPRVSLGTEPELPAHANWQIAALKVKSSAYLMRQIADQSGSAGNLRERNGGVQTRVWRSMVGAVVVASVISAAVAPWRVTSGLILGGLLSLFNYRWLHTSVTAIFNVDPVAERPSAGVSRYFLRYMVVGAIVFAAYNLQLVSLAATLAGLCSFVPALLIEAGREFYLAIIHREESF
jgi:hypothetical protein